jgi:hypothetical protein
VTEHVTESGDDTARATPHEWFVDTHPAIDTFRRGQSADWSRLRPEFETWVDQDRTIRR